MNLRANRLNKDEYYNGGNAHNDPKRYNNNNNNIFAKRASESPVLERIIMDLREIKMVQLLTKSTKQVEMRNRNYYLVSILTKLSHAVGDQNINILSEQEFTLIKKLFF